MQKACHTNPDGQFLFVTGAGVWRKVGNEADKTNHLVIPPTLDGNPVWI